jgi:hypothetical protein
LKKKEKNQGRDLDFFKKCENIKVGNL